ncbi:pyridoxal phosphate-dependent aminotransferase [Dysosmobacter sp.]|uniref:pyridoxal phosphate-dependent aminotransferase n=1 Tax=Dysosmobacter sp. TaxID=2591382 RepID=UPI002A8AF4F9|nr:pyridoxal phosphate-dependent aminotransferase [Dysosmobacter sp.]MDY3280922.1 pyridoxal phosphate-dependent aminotransferase [Dysosmobacter sp.]
MQFSNHMDEIQLSKIRQIGELAGQMAKEGRSVIKLQVGEPDFDTPQHIIDAAIASLNRKETHYAHNRGTMECRKAISDKLWRDNGIKADPEKNILVLNGCAEALQCATLGILDPGEEMIIIEPTFINYIQLAKMAQCTPVIVRAREENGWLPDVEDIEKAITSRTRILLLNSPTNPTGAVYPRELLEQIAQLCVKHNLIVVSDEVYEKLIYGDAKHVSIASIPGMEDRTITINGLSKAYAMTGWRLGYVAADENLVLPMLKVHQYSTTCLPVFVQAGAAEALNNGEADVEAMRREYQRRRDMLAKLLLECEDLSLRVPDGTFYMYPNISKLGIDSHSFVFRLLEETGVATTYGTAFDQKGEGNIRISFANSEENLREGAARILQFIAKVR